MPRTLGRAMFVRGLYRQHIGETLPRRVRMCTRNKRHLPLPRRGPPHRSRRVARLPAGMCRPCFALLVAAATAIAGCFAGCGLGPNRSAIRAHDGARAKRTTHERGAPAYSTVRTLPSPSRPMAPPPANGPQSLTRPGRSPMYWGSEYVLDLPFSQRFPQLQAPPS
ncbi:MAG: hypothetical protein RL385_5382 [Pseudomonadota bacterium]